MAKGGTRGEHGGMLYLIRRSVPLVALVTSAAHVLCVVGGLFLTVNYD